MSRSGYTEDCDDNWQWIKWRGRVASAERGKRGQVLLRELRDALDAMPVKRLIADELVTQEGEYCALGVLGAKRGIDMQDLDPEDGDRVGEAFGIASCMAQEIVYFNDEQYSHLTPEKRWNAMRYWVDALVIRTPDERKVEDAIKREIARRGWIENKYGTLPYGNTNVEISDDGVNVMGTANYVDGRKITDPDNERFFSSHGFATDGRNGEKKDMMLNPIYWRYPRAT